jgi:hypothetical protein
MKNKTSKTNKTGNNANLLLPAVRPSVTWFATEMEKKLAINDHKGGWKKCEIDWLIERIEAELEELKLLYGFRKADYGRSVSDGVEFVDISNEAIISECADIANFAMMVADKFGDEHCR